MLSVIACNVYKLQVRLRAGGPSVQTLFRLEQMASQMVPALPGTEICRLSLSYLVHTYLKASR